MLKATSDPSTGLLVLKLAYLEPLDACGMFSHLLL